MRRTAWLVLIVAAAACDLVPRFGGAYHQDAPIAIGAAGNSSVKLVLGQYGPEVAGHLSFPDLATCPCLYVQGTTDGDTVTVEPQPTAGCALVFKRAEFELTSAGLRGRLKKLDESGADVVDMTDEFELKRDGEQSDLGADDLKGCHE
jgi:hypothetical protein